MRTIATAVLCVLLALPVLANEDGVVPGYGPDYFEYTEPGRDLIDAWNDNQPPCNYTYAGSCFGFGYIPSMDYTLERIEWYAGDIPGTVTVELRGDGGEGVPNGPVLGSVTYQENPPRGWQGQNLVPSVPLTAGTQYWIAYSVVVGAQVSASTSGTIIPHWWGDDCATWSGPWNSLAWMARFYGCFVTPAAEGTWSMVKSLY